jgi:hypothetical protein
MRSISSRVPIASLGHGSFDKALLEIAQRHDHTHWVPRPLQKNWFGMFLQPRKDFAQRLAKLECTDSPHFIDILSVSSAANLLDVVPFPGAVHGNQGGA